MAWNGYRLKGARKAPAKASGPKGGARWQTSLLYLAVALIIIALIYVSYTAVLPQLAAFLGQGGPAPGVAGNATNTIINVTYIKG